MKAFFFALFIVVYSALNTELCTSQVLNKRINEEPGMAATVCNPSTQEAEIGGLRVPGQPGLHL
jgi:hypothetical protein